MTFPRCRRRSHRCYSKEVGILITVRASLTTFFPCSAAGKILRRELRERAKEELKGRDPSDAILECKL